MPADDPALSTFAHGAHALSRNGSRVRSLHVFATVDRAKCPEVGKQELLAMDKLLTLPAR
jgi:hypothetical protein